MLVPDDADAVGRIGGIAQREMVAAFVEMFPNAPTIRLVEPKVGQTWGDLEIHGAMAHPQDRQLKMTRMGMDANQRRGLEGSGQSK